MRIPWSKIQSALERVMDGEYDIGICLNCGEEQEIPFGESSICYACEERGIKYVENISLNIGIDYDS